MKIFRYAFLALLPALLLFPARLYGGPGVSIGVDDGWVWQVAVLPPPGGWDSDTGKSAMAAVRYAEQKVKDSPGGVAGRDIHFLQEPPLTDENVRARLEDWRKNGIPAVISLGGEDDGRLLEPLLDYRGPVFVTAFGEEEEIAAGGAPHPMMFALDLYKDFRMAAFTQYAVMTLEKGSTLAILGDRFDPYLDRFARNLGDMLSAAGFSADHYWLPGAGPDSFRMIESEAVSGRASVMVSCAGSMVVREIWRAVRKKENAFGLWYGGVPVQSLLSFNGVHVADQDAPLDRDGAFIRLGREIWEKTRVTARDRKTAGRAYAVCSWVFDGLGKAGSRDPVKLSRAMETAGGIPFGSLELSINAATHRPRFRDVAILEARDRNFNGVAFFQVAGPEYLP